MTINHRFCSGFHIHPSSGSWFLCSQKSFTLIISSRETNALSVKVILPSCLTYRILTFSFDDVDHWWPLLNFFTILLLICVLVFCPRGRWDIYSLSRDWTYTFCIGRWSLNYWTIREVLSLHNFDQEFPLICQHFDAFKKIYFFPIFIRIVRCP